MNGYRMDWFLLEILPTVFFALGLFAYAIRLGKLYNWLKKLTPLLLYAAIKNAHKFFDFLNTAPFFFFLVMLLLFLWCLSLHYKNIGLSLFACGGIANAVVSLVNGGRMPMSEIPAAYDIYQPMTDKTILPFLCDWILSPCKQYYLSFGDILLEIGLLIFAFQGLLFFYSKWKARNSL